MRTRRNSPSPGTPSSATPPTPTRRGTRRHRPAPRTPRTAHTAHSAADEETRETGRLSVADVVVRRAAENDARLGPPAAWASEALDRYPYCGLVAYVDGPDRCVVRTREGDLVRLSAATDPDGRPDLCDPAVYASALHAWLTDGHTLDAALPAITVRTGTAAHHVTVEPLPQPPPSAGSHASDSASSPRSRSAPIRSPFSS
ncbi:hypothetical protein TPA0906_33810 [Streptomyces olivaceus]|uniref:hypothetical protein n=1 Tax=Streptomyces olivaceus TaxID=47716 RepID=UPI0022ED5BF5|nr:hypothetical protein [Streptomyces olivaceus]GHJ01516.1 hypothetical protein TPA0906_33810 [Streptomyces olivaceus]